MKTNILRGVGLFSCAGMFLALSLCPAPGQVPGLPARPISQLNPQPFNPAPPSPPSDSGPKFDLDFPGGSPDRLIRAIEDATGEPLNAIVPPEEAAYNLPAFKVRQVNVENLFKALETASARKEAYVTGTYFGGLGGGRNSQYSTSETSAGFQKQGNLWVFLVKRPAYPPNDGNTKTARFYQLEPFLTKNTIEDITTAIQTAWSMMGKTKSNTADTLKFHQETKLLIAVGEESQLQVIDDVLQALRPELYPRVVRPPTHQPTTNAPPKAESK